MSAQQEKFKFYLIGVGLPRTGTKSTKVALEKILPGKCMHFSSVIRGNIKEFMHDIVEDSSTDEMFRKYFEKHNIVAGIDTPFVNQYKRALEIFPDAKVLLTIREPLSWVTSMEQTVYPVWYGESLFEEFPFYLLNYVDSKMVQFWNYNKNHDVMQSALQHIHEGKGEIFYNSWVENIKKTIPKDRLLIFNVKEGWEPLCKFLNVPVPMEKFPHVNDKDEFQRTMRYHRTRAFIIFITIAIIIPLTLALFIAKLCNII